MRSESNRESGSKVESRIVAGSESFQTEGKECYRRPEQCKSRERDVSCAWWPCKVVQMGMLASPDAGCSTSQFSEDCDRARATLETTVVCSSRKVLATAQ